MRLVSTKSLSPGAKLAQSICNENGLILIQSNVCLTKKMIQRLINQGVNHVYIDDQLTSGIVIESVIPHEMRVEALNTVKRTFLDLKENGFAKKTFLLDKQNLRIRSSVEKIIKEIKSEKRAISLLADIMLTDDYTFQHSLNVAIYSLAIGIKLKLSDKELSKIGIGAILHDIGKIFIDDSILDKPDKLTDSEFEIIKSHTQLGYDFLRNETDLSTVIAHCAYQHHERLDGSGYPRGLKHNEIHKYAKVIAVADVFDALTSNRVYRSAILPNEALEIIYAGAVDIFDREIVEAFKEGIVIFPNGLTVQLSDGRIGVVSQQNQHVCDRPIIRVLIENKEKLKNPYELNLAQVVNVTITSCYIE